MKQVLVLIVALFSTLCASAEEKSLVITFSDNTKAEYALSTLPDITMENDKLTVTTSTTTAQFDLYKVKTFTFSSTTGISVLDRQQFALNGDALVIDGESSKTRIFSIDGKAVSIDPIISNGKTILDISSLSRGVYIINANGKSIKILKK